MTVQHATAGTSAGTSPPLPREAPPASAHDLTKTYGTGPTAVRALRGVTVVFPRGTFTAVMGPSMGPSGSGKSTPMHCVVHCPAGLDRPTTGQGRVGGEDLSTLDDRQLTRVRRDRIGFVFQSFNLVPTLTTLQNILLPLDLAGRRADPARLGAVVGAVVDALGIGDRLGHRPGELSGGEQQRAAMRAAML